MQLLELGCSADAGSYLRIVARRAELCNGTTTPACVRPKPWAGAVMPRSSLKFAKSELINSGSSSARMDLLNARSGFRRRDGVYRWFLIRAKPLRDKTGQI